MSKIVCFGEVLWDVFPTHKKIGGAPLNVVLRLKSFGNNVAIISSVENDSSGKEKTDFITKNKISIENFQVNKTRKTREVNVVLYT